MTSSQRCFRRRATSQSDMTVPPEQSDPAVQIGYPADLNPEEQAFQRLYGPWRPLSVAEAREVFAPLEIPWWIAGGYAIEAFTGVRRHHEDIDVSVFRRDLERLKTGLKDRYHIWAAGPDGLCPLDDKQMKMPESADQVWLREHALAPWRADVLLNPDADGDWVSRRNPSFAAPLDEVTWTRDGVRYLRPEIALAFKAKRARPKDERDFAAAEPLLGGEARAWLSDYLARCEPEHSWRARL